MKKTRLFFTLMLTVCLVLPTDIEEKVKWNLLVILRRIGKISYFVKQRSFRQHKLMILSL